jgi:hypothetical protein
MPNKKISELTNNTIPPNDDLVVINDQNLTKKTPLFNLEYNLFTQFPVLTSSRNITFTNPTGYANWTGGVLGPNGKIYGIPHDASGILIIDTLTDTTSSSNMGVNMGGDTLATRRTAKWWGGVLAPNGKIYAIPFSNQSEGISILAIDTLTNTATASDRGITFSDSAKWVGGVFPPNGKIYGIPYNSTDILIIDTISDTVTRSTMGATLTGTSKWSGGVLGQDGMIYGMPDASNDILIIDPLANTATRSTMGANVSTGTWKGGALGSNGKIYGFPSAGGHFLIIDTITKTSTLSSFGIVNQFGVPSAAVCNGGVLAPNGKIYTIPEQSTLQGFRSFVINTYNDTAVPINLPDGGNYLLYNGAVLAPNGKIYGIPRYATTVLTITPDLNTSAVNIPIDRCISAYYNKL